MRGAAIVCYRYGMPGPRHVRALISAVVVPVYLLGALHMAFVAHTLSASGAVVEVGDDAHAHAHSDASFCDPASDSFSAPDHCLAVSWSKTPFSAERVHLVVAPRAVVSVFAHAEESAGTGGLDVLHVAPKGSPPAA